MNDLRKFFYSRIEGRGIWKWDHYFEIYDRHFSRFRNSNVTLVEIGIYSGGSLEMWRDYFGPYANIIGIDIQPECLEYADGLKTKIYIGNQSSKDFWKTFRKAEPNIDILIDDGSHKYRHQITTFTEMFPHIQPGGVFLCEDIHSYPAKDKVSEFAEYMNDISLILHAHDGFVKNSENDSRRLYKKTNYWQEHINSITMYPYVCVVEKNKEAISEFVAPKRGTQWQPFKP